MATIKVTDAKDTKEDTRFKEINENKIEKSLRNSKDLQDAIRRAKKGEFDIDVEDVTNADLLKINEKWSIRKQFSLAEGKHFYKLYKEVFYIADPHKNYFETVATKQIMRRIAAQKEQGDLDWAKAVSKEMHVDIVE